ncbi:MAG: TonB-dependent receptor [Tardiphaga sp.]|uniref:TonB-dependent receptor n=1 Tax=Tardiphaga sp. TaxID=1926292 RepID=UPI002632B324|nr:TonB-dependent receptor [Tardiphaga sp.]MDB5503578.1 TonB-dependent receptor [Tardiphaga sp.]
MTQRHARSGASTLVLCSALFTLPVDSMAQQMASHDLPAVTVDAPAPRQGVRPVRRPQPRAASASRRSRPVVASPAASPAPQTDASVAHASLGNPPIKDKYQLPQTSASITAAEIQQKINIVDTEDSVKYMPSLFVRKRNAGDTQPVLATRTAGVGASARSLVYADDILLTALIANNNTLGAPRWGLVAPEEIQRVDFLYGPFSAAYPGNSLGGVLLITTKMPEKFEFTAKQTEAFQTFDRYNTKGTFRTDQTSLSIGDRKGDFSYLISGNYQNSYSQPLSWITNATAPAGTSGTIAAQNKLGAAANVVGAGGLLHTEMANVKGKVAWDITPLVKATFTTGFWSNDADSSVQTYLRNAAGTPTFGGVAGFASSYYTLSQKHLANSISVKSDTKGTFDFDVSVSRYDFLEDIQRSPYGVASAGATFTPDGKIARLDGTHWTNGDAKGIWRPNDFHEVSFGVHADRYVLSNPTYATATWNGGADSTSSLYTDSRGATQTTALWIQDAWKFAPDFKLTLGGRLENWNASEGFNLATIQTASGGITGTTSVNQPELNATRFSPKASLSWTPSAQWEVTGSFGQAYRFPTVTELYQIVQTGSIYSTPNPNLKPENGLSEEIAIQRKFTDGNIRLSLFNEYIRDALISQTGFLTGATPVSFVTNVDEIRNTGVELAIRKDNVVIHGLELFGSVTYVDSRILSDPSFVSTTGTTAVGKRVPNTPDWRATAGATYRPNAWWAFTAAARYSGKQYSTLDNTDVVSNVYGAFDSFTVVDLRAQYRFSETAQASFGIDNVGDYKYTLFHPFPGRTYVADVRIKF